MGGGQATDEAKRTFINTVLGETWAESGEAPDWQRLYERREDWCLGTVPAGGLFLTAGADVQKDRIEVSVWAWGRGLEAGSSITSSSTAARRSPRRGPRSPNCSARPGHIRRALSSAWRSSRSTSPAPVAALGPSRRYLLSPDCGGAGPRDRPSAGPRTDVAHCYDGLKAQPETGEAKE